MPEIFETRTENFIAPALIVPGIVPCPDSELRAGRSITTKQAIETNTQESIPRAFTLTGAVPRPYRSIRIKRGAQCTRQSE